MKKSISCTIDTFIQCLTFISNVLVFYVGIGNCIRRHFYCADSYIIVNAFHIKSNITYKDLQ